MNTQDAYNSWADTYDTVENKTRDLESWAIRSVLGDRSFNDILEIGCGTGKNTTWLAAKCRSLTAVDFSPEMLSHARKKTIAQNVRFQQADITEKWNFEKTDLITSSLVLEHIQDISFIFEQASLITSAGSYFFICELHPFKQLQGSRARFEQNGNILHLEYFIHHISEFFESAAEHGFVCDSLQEWFDSKDKSEVPRLVSFLFRRK